MAYDAFDVVTVPLPFTDSARTKRRPALVLSASRSFGDVIGHGVLAMITSAKNAPWPLDVTIGDLKSAGLPAPSVVRLKLFTLDHRFIVAKIGSLSKRDREAIRGSLSALLDIK